MFACIVMKLGDRRRSLDHVIRVKTFDDRRAADRYKAYIENQMNLLGLEEGGEHMMPGETSHMQKWAEANEDLIGPMWDQEWNIEYERYKKQNPWPIDDWSRRHLHPHNCYVLISPIEE